MPNTTTHDTPPLLDMRELTISFGDRTEVHGIDLTVHSGEIVALVGESGSGKSLTARAILGLLPPQATVTGRLSVHTATGTHQLVPRDSRATAPALRGRVLGLIPQDALGGLDPLRRIELEVGDSLRVHGLARGAARRARVIAALESAGMPDAERRLSARADELSGGLRQRALIAAALIAEPELLIADEPTTALDAAHRSRVLAALRQRADAGAGALLISHDLASVRDTADYVLVMHRGTVIESGPVAELFAAPQHAVTRELLAASPAGKPRGSRLLAVSSNARAHTASCDAPSAPSAPAPRLELRHLVQRFGRGTAQRTVLDGASLTVAAGETVGLLGASGSGKTTLLRIALGLLAPEQGEVRIDGIDRATADRTTRRALRRRLAFVPQDPLDSFPPGATGVQLLSDALRAAGTPRVARATRIAELASEVHLALHQLQRPAATLSGGQRQRLAIARALARDPHLILLDEPVSALDLTVQARVLDLLDEVQQQRGTSYLFVSHDADVIAHMSDRIVRLHNGVLTRLASLCT